LSLLKRNLLLAELTQLNLIEQEGAKNKLSEENASSDRMELVVSQNLTAVADALHTVVTKVSQDSGRLLISNRGFS
jgi:hypothetical protein